MNCKTCGRDLSLVPQPINFCPTCGVPLKADKISSLKGIAPELLAIARVWPNKDGWTRAFCLAVLKLHERVANRLEKAGMSAVEVLTMDEEAVMTRIKSKGIKDFGEKSFRMLEKAKKEWKR
jgi:hypothetical protein